MRKGKLVNTSAGWFCQPVDDGESLDITEPMATVLREETMGADVLRRRAERERDEAKRDRDAAEAALKHDFDRRMQAEMERDEALRQLTVQKECCDGWAAATRVRGERIAVLRGALQYIEHHLKCGGLYGPWTEDAKTRICTALDSPALPEVPRG